MNNSKELKVKYHGNKEKPSRFKNRNVASMSKLGYRDDSPYNTLPYIDVHTPSGRIDMSGTGIPLWANGRILPPYSGVHQFDTTQVKEIPLAQDGQEVYNMERAKQLYTPDETGHWPSVDYETGEWLKSKVHPTAWMEYLYGYTLNPQQALNYDVRTNPQGYFGENTLQYIPKKQKGGSLPMAQDGTEVLFQKYYGQVDRSDADPAGFDYYMYRNPEFETLSSADRSALIKRMKNFLQYTPGPRATQDESVDTNTVFPDTLEQIDRSIRRENTELQTNKDLTPKKPFGHGSYEYEDYKSGGSWLEQYQDKKSIVDTVKAKYASRPSSAPSEKQSDIILNVPKTLTAQKSTTDTGINKKNIESELEINSRYVSPGSYGKDEIFTENYINKLKKDYNVDLEYDPADPFFRIAGLFGNPPGAYYNPFTRTINYGTEFGYEELDPETHPYVRHDMLMHEIPHAIQFDRHKSVIGKLGEARRMLSGLLMGQNERYDTPGTFEYEAHNPIEQKLRDDFDKAWDEWDGETVRRKGGSWLNQYE